MLAALEAIEAYLSARPEDLRTREIRADLLLQSGRLAEYLDLRDRLVRAKPDAERIARLGLYLPSGLTLTAAQVDEVASAVRSVAQRLHRPRAASVGQA